jgi:hypothetical protein
MAVAHKGYHVKDDDDDDDDDDNLPPFLAGIFMVFDIYSVE